MNPEIGSGGPPAPQDSQRYSEDSVSQPDQFPTANHGATHGIDRRTVIRGVGIVGVGVAGAATLAACGVGSNTANQTGSAASGAAGSAGSGKAVVKAADIPVGGRHGLRRGKGGGDPAQGGGVQGLQRYLHPHGLHGGRRRQRHDHLPMSRKHVRRGHRSGHRRPGPPAPLPSKTVTVSGGSITIS